MRKITFIKDMIAPLCLALCALTVSALFTGCPSADGLHNQPALMVKFEFTGFGNISGNYSIPGSFDGDANNWTKKIADVDVVMKDGSGISNPIPVISTWIEFSLCPTGGDWERPWHTEDGIDGNAVDRNSGIKQNIYYTGLNLTAGEVTLLVDASSGTATVDVK